MEADLNLGGTLGATQQLLRAAQYVRKSDDHQKYSTENQSDTNHAYASAHAMEIICTYADEGKSGLTFEKRDGLKRLLADVQSGCVPFKAILVYDISRWGRYQDVDESAHYEFLCRRAGIAVHYCAEQFANDGSPLSSLFKNLKRAAAAEYSRELSIKVFAGQVRIVQLGYRLGGYAGYGLRRLLVGQDGTVKAVLERGEQKCIATDRIVLVPGPAVEVEIVRSIFRMFTEENRREQQIANVLNGEGKATEFGRAWSGERIRYILKSEKYAGHNVWNHLSFKLQATRVRNAPGAWVRADRVFEAIVEEQTFEAAQVLFAKRLKQSITGRQRRYSDQKMLSALRRLLKREGHLSRRIIDVSSEVQSAGAYENRFGSLSRAYQLIGYKRGKHSKEQRIRPTRHSIYFSDAEMLDGLRKLLRVRGTLTTSIIEESGSIPCGSAYCRRFGSIRNAYQLIGFVPSSFAKRWHRPEKLSDEQMLDALRNLLREHGYLNRDIIDSASEVPSSYAYGKRFGSLLRAYELVEYTVRTGRYRADHPLRRSQNTSRVLGEGSSFRFGG